MDSNRVELWPSNSSYSPIGHVYDLTSEISSNSSISASPTMSEFEMYTPPLYQPTFSSIPNDPSFNFPIPHTPKDFGSPDEGPFYTRRTSATIPTAHAGPEKTHSTSGRRRAQNRAAQRAFRERKEKHAKDLEGQLSELSIKYNNLETSHAELSAAYEKLQKTVELLTNSDDADEGTNSAETFRKFLSILHGEMKLKKERET